MTDTKEMASPWQDFIDGQLLALAEQDELVGTFAGDVRRNVLRDLLDTLAGQGVSVDVHDVDLAPRSTHCWEPAHQRVPPTDHSCLTCCAHPEHDDQMTEVVREPLDICDILAQWASAADVASPRAGTGWLAVGKSDLLARLVYGGERGPSQTPCPVHKGHWAGVHFGWPGSGGEESEMLRKWWDAGCRCATHKGSAGTTGWNPDEHCCADMVKAERDESREIAEGDVRPHRYSPDSMAMGDCKRCDHVADSPLHAPVGSEPRENDDDQMAPEGALEQALDQAAPKEEVRTPNDRLGESVIAALQARGNDYGPDAVHRIIEAIEDGFALRRLPDGWRVIRKGDRLSVWDDGPRRTTACGIGTTLSEALREAEPVIETLEEER